VSFSLGRLSYNSDLFHTNRGISGAFHNAFKFGCSGSMGALLVLPEGGSREDLRKRGLFYQHAAENAVSWYKFVNGPKLNRGVENGSLYLVTGCDKCPAWGVASYSNPSGRSDISLKFTVNGGNGSTLAYDWETSSSAEVRSGCQQNKMGPNGLLQTDPVFNQCVFVRGFRISLQPRLFRMLLGVKVEEGINPLVKTESPTIPFLPGSRLSPPSLAALLQHSSPSFPTSSHQNITLASGGDVLLEHIPCVSQVSCQL
jgi:hypothetical protein